jgi:hypothetical protein
MVGLAGAADGEVEGADALGPDVWASPGSPPMHPLTTAIVATKASSGRAGT